MRGDEKQQPDVQLHQPGTASARRAPVASDPPDGGSGLGRSVVALCRAVRSPGTAFDSSGATAAGPAVTGAVRDTQRAATDGTDRFQPAVPVGCGAGDGGSGLGCDGVQQEPRPPAGGRGVATLAAGGGGTGASAELAE